jgi:protein-L-isoaspartate(D-aspartate) O-methyltransferase
MGCPLKEERRRLLDRIRDELGDLNVIQAMQKVDRANFVPPSSVHLAYEDIPLPIGDNQTISQPFMVALMIGALDLRASDRVLEVGTGSGYQAAVLARLAREVVTVERIPSLAESADNRLKTLGVDNVRVHLVGEELGWPDGAPFDTVVVSAGAPTLPRKLIDQLVVGGRMVAPVGSMGSQELMRVVRTADGFSVRTLGSCRFVPLIGPDAWPDGTMVD